MNSKMLARMITAGIILLTLLITLEGPQNPVSADDSPVIKIVLDNSGTPTDQTSFTVQNESTFIVDVMVNTSVPIRGYDITISYEPTKIQVASLGNIFGGDQAGYFLQDWADANPPDVVNKITTTRDNTNGKVRVGYFIAGSTLGGPTGSGKLFAIKFTALAGVNSTAIIGLTLTATSAGVMNTADGAFVASTYHNATVNIGTAISTSPVIGSFAPQIAGQGWTIAISGLNFTGATGVSFGGMAAQSYTVNTEGTQISAVVGNGASGDVIVNGQDGTNATMSGFIFVPPPVISSISPDYGRSGGTVTMIGQHFWNTSSSEVTAVKFGGLNAQSFSCETTGIDDTPHKITAIIGNGASGEITISNAYGTGTLAGFNFIGETTFTDFSPKTAGQGDTITITGTNFVGSVSVSFGGQAARSTTLVSSTQITAVVNEGSASGNVVVSCSGISLTQSGFTFNSPTPTTSTTPTATPTSTSTPTSTPSSTPTTGSTPTLTAPTVTDVATPSPSPTTVRKASSGRPTTTSPPKPASTRKPVSAPSLATSQTLDLSGLTNGAGLFADQFTGTLRNTGFKPISVEIKSGTRAIQGDGSPLTDIWASPPSIFPSSPASGRIINAFELEPIGATFSTPVHISFQYDSAQISRGEDERNITLGYYDPIEGHWIDCDYSLDTQNHMINANLSHFSLYAIIITNSSGILNASATNGFGWNLAGAVILSELLLGGLVVYLFLRRRRQFVSVTQAVAPVFVQDAVSLPPPAQILERRTTSEPSESQEAGRVLWEDILKDSNIRGAPFNTNLEIVGGKVIIPRDGKSTDIELINMPDSQILIALEYDPEVIPRGKAKIVVLGTSKEYTRSKENEK